MKKRETGILVVFATLTILGILIFALSMAWKKTRRISCVSNLKSMGLSLMQYAMDYDNQLPGKDGFAGWEMLRSQNYLTDYRIYHCPSSGTKVPTSGALTEKTVDYLYIGSGFSSKDNGNIPIAFDKHGNHKNYANILFIDGKVARQSLKDTSPKGVIEFLISTRKYPTEIQKKLREKGDKR
jgi:prepilin-type processing-associated H-X9-DG protein